MAFVLYLITGIATAVPVVYALGWAVWGAPISATEYISLFGSLLLVLAAFITFVNRRHAARCAFAGVIAVWSFYLPQIYGVVRMKLTDQRLTLRVLKWAPSARPLTTSDGAGPNSPLPSLTRVEFDLLKGAGLEGKVATFSLGNYGRGSKTSRAIVVIQRPVVTRVELPEPDATTVVYIQEGNGWRKYPPGAPTLKRTILIQPERGDLHQSSVRVELSTGARQGFDVWWPKQELGRP